MFNGESIDKTPTVNQVKAIIEYMEQDKSVGYNFFNMMGMQRLQPNKIKLDLNNAHLGEYYEIVFNDENEIISFKNVGRWMS